MSTTESMLQDVFKDDWTVSGEWREAQVRAADTLSLPKVGKFNFKPYQFDQITPSFQKRETVTALPEEIKPFITDEENIVVLYDGSIIYRNLDESFKDLKIVSYYEALEQKDEEALQALLGDVKEESRDRLHALNKAYRNSGLFIKAPKNATFKETLKVHLIAGQHDLVHRSVIIAETSSQLTLLEKIDNVNTARVSITTQTEVKDNANVTYLGIDRLCEESLAYIDRRANVYRDGNLTYGLGQLNDGHTISNNVVYLKGVNANCETRSVLMTDRKSIHAVTVHVEHFAEHSIGNIINHGIVKDEGYLHIDGIGKINKGMKQSNAQQESHVIILSREAKVDANPYLLIDEYDVLAGHGAGIGQVDAEQLYYMMSRGMKRTEAEKLIIIGFLSPIVEMIDSEKIREDFMKTIETKLSDI